MSYLNPLRLVFAGDFQADVSTVNNDVRIYDNTTFEDRFQELFVNAYPAGNPDIIYNGYWNPVGSGAFRIINSTVRGVYYQDGSSATTPINGDHSVGLYINGSNNRVGAKLVDLDPQWQSSSEIWGLTIRLSDSNGKDLLVGQFEPAPFRDLWLNRQQGNIADWDQPASAAFQSVLTHLQWATDLSQYRFLQELKEVTEAFQGENGMLSIMINTFAYKRDPKVNRFSLGRLVGAIGPYVPNEPHSVVIGRRMVPKILPNQNPLRHKINFFNGTVDQPSSSIFLDLGNALPFTIENENQNNEYIEMCDLGRLRLAVLCPQNETYPAEGDQVTKDHNFILLGNEIVYQYDQDPDWLNRTAGIWSTKIPEAYYPLVFNQPLALIQMIDNSNGTVLIRESENGLLVRADNFVNRVEPGNTIDVTLFAAQYGQPLPHANVIMSLATPEQEAGMPVDSKDHPLAPIPYTNIPAEAVIFPSSLTTHNQGKAILNIKTTDPNNPRGYIDGQIYQIIYLLDRQPSNQQHILDGAILLLFNTYQVPEQPTWLEHIQPIFQQYANLYPIMSKKLVDLSNYESVKTHRAILDLAFSLAPSDPNYMPVGRDLSDPKRTTILKWLRQKNYRWHIYPSLWLSKPTDCFTL